MRRAFADWMRIAGTGLALGLLVLAGVALWAWLHAGAVTAKAVATPLIVIGVVLLLFSGLGRRIGSDQPPGGHPPVYESPVNIARKSGLDRYFLSAGLWCLLLWLAADALIGH